MSRKKLRRQMRPGRTRGNPSSDLVAGVGIIQVGMLPVVMGWTHGTMV